MFSGQEPSSTALAGPSGQLLAAVWSRALERLGSKDSDRMTRIEGRAKDSDSGRLGRTRISASAEPGGPRRCWPAGLGGSAAASAPAASSSWRRAASPGPSTPPAALLVRVPADSVRRAKRRRRAGATPPEQLRAPRRRPPLVARGQEVGTRPTANNQRRKSPLQSCSTSRRRTAGASRALPSNC